MVASHKNQDPEVRHDYDPHTAIGQRFAYFGQNQPRLNPTSPLYRPTYDEEAYHTEEYGNVYPAGSYVPYVVRPADSAILQFSSSVFVLRWSATPDAHAEWQSRADHAVTAFEFRTCTIPHHTRRGC